MGCIGAAITVVELVEGPDRLPAGRALDLGCGAGRNALYLAAHDWDTIGVEMAGYAVELATRAATAKALPARFLQEMSHNWPSWLSAAISLCSWMVAATT